LKKLPQKASRGFQVAAPSWRWNRTKRIGLIDLFDCAPDAEAPHLNPRLPAMRR
jgi:hypothetical protein